MTLSTALNLNLEYGKKYRICSHNEWYDEELRKVGSGVVNGVIYRESMYIRVWFVERVCTWKLDVWDRVGDEPSLFGERLDAKQPFADREMSLLLVHRPLRILKDDRHINCKSIIYRVLSLFFKQNNGYNREF